jgi:hypothetical protein
MTRRGLVPQYFSHVPSTKVREIAAMLKTIHASEDIVAAREKAIRVIEKLRALRLRAAELAEAAVGEILTYCAAPAFARQAAARGPRGGRPAEGRQRP